MSFFNIISGGCCMRNNQEREKASGLEEQNDNLKKMMEQEPLLAQENRRRDRGVALEALRRKKVHEEQVAPPSHVDCSVGATKSAREIIDIIYKMNDLITEEEDEAQDTFVESGAEFNEEDPLAELEKVLNEIVIEKDQVEAVQVLSPASLSHPDMMEEGDIEDDLEYLLRWAAEPL